MRPAENIEKLIKRLRYTASAETHDKVIGNVMQVLDKQDEHKSSVTTPDRWRTIMNSKMVKFAVAAVIIIAVLIGFYTFSGSSGTVYADVVRQLQKARTLMYTVTTTTSIEFMPEMKMEVAFKEPGYMRMTMPGGYVSVMDAVQGKGLSIIPDKKQFIEIDMTNLPDEPAQKQTDVIENLRTLPERADEDLGEQIKDGRTVHGFRVSEGGLTYNVWIDPENRGLVLVEIEFDNAPGMSATMSDFKFDVELDDSLFSLTPPDGYTRSGLQWDASEPSEDDLIEFLRLWSSFTKDNTFLPTVNPAELPKVVMEMIKDGKFGPDREVSEQDQLLLNTITMKTTRAVMFVMKLPAESNWRYAGQNVKYGDAERPIFWYQPPASPTYRVIYGDLSIKDVAAEDLPE